MSQLSSAALDGLPKQFLSALRTLFNILDEKGTGFVNLSDIETRWRDDGHKGIPKGVIENLRKVTPPNGLLSFERFCAGLKICLLHNQMDLRNRNESWKKCVEPQRPPSAPILDSNCKSTKEHTVSLVKPTISMPHLPGEKPNIKQSHLYGPPKPPRMATLKTVSTDKAEIRAALQNWQLAIIMSGNDDKDSRNTIEVKACSVSSSNQQSNGIHKKAHPSSRRREPRRHTLQHGIDYNMIKKTKQIEREKEALMQGLDAVERARQWYLKQISMVQEKIKYLGRIESWTEVHQERIELQRARILEVNRHLAALTDGGERGGLPLHMNLAVHPHSSGHLQLLPQLKQRNMILSEEINQKNETIATLEREKASLLRELYQTRAQSSSIRRIDGPHKENAAYI